MSFQTQFHVSFRTEFSKKVLPNIMLVPHNAMFPSNYREDKNIESAIIHLQGIDILCTNPVLDRRRNFHLRP